MIPPRNGRNPRSARRAGNGLPNIGKNGAGLPNIGKPVLACGGDARGGIPADAQPATARMFATTERIASTTAGEASASFGDSPLSPLAQIAPSSGTFPANGTP